MKVALWGGYEGAERCVAAFYAGDPPEAGDWPVVALRLQWNAKFANPGHRDLLGAMMGLGIEREMTGDIAMGTYRDAPCAYLFALEEVADYIAANLDSAGRASLKVSVATMLMRGHMARQVTAPRMMPEGMARLLASPTFDMTQRTMCPPRSFSTTSTASAMGTSSENGASRVAGVKGAPMRRWL